MLNAPRNSMMRCMRSMSHITSLHCLHLCCSNASKMQALRTLARITAVCVNAFVCACMQRTLYSRFISLALNNALHIAPATATLASHLPPLPPHHILHPARFPHPKPAPWHSPQMHPQQQLHKRH